MNAAETSSPTYNEDILKYSEHVKPNAACVAETLDLKNRFGVTDAAITGSILEEYADRHKSKLDEFRQWRADIASQLINQTQLGIKEEYEFLKEHDEIRKSVGDGWDKLNYPTMIDLGPGNVQLYTAISLLDEYNAKHPKDDPLQIKQYNDDYRGLLVHLVEGTHGTTEKFAGLMIERVAEWNEKNTANWNQLSTEEKNATAVAGFRFGIETLDAKRENAINEHCREEVRPLVAQLITADAVLRPQMNSCSVNENISLVERFDACTKTTPYHASPYATPNAVEYLANHQAVEKHHTSKNLAVVGFNSSMTGMMVVPERNADACPAQSPSTQQAAASPSIFSQAVSGLGFESAAPALQTPIPSDHGVCIALVSETQQMCKAAAEPEMQYREPNMNDVEKQSLPAAMRGARARPSVGLAQ